VRTKFWAERPAAAIAASPSPIADIGPPRPSDTRWITGTVALFAIAVFAVSGSQVGPAMVQSGGQLDPHHVSAFLLNIALILFAWRRSVQLKKTYAQRDAAETRASELAHRDEVTGLLNRRRLKELLRDLCAEKVARSALILIDLDGFKKINDLYGHAVGDEILLRTAERIVDVCPPEASCVRLGGDEFAILLQAGHASQPQAKELMIALIAALSRPIRTSSTIAAVGVSVGVAVRTKAGKDPEWLLRRADIAMYEAKRRGRNRGVEFDGDMETELERRTLLEREMRSGIETGEFVPYFQPIIDLASGETRGFEVLARWRHPTKGLIQPAGFMELAEATGMISELSFRVMHEALTVARDWPAHFQIAVNLSPVQFNDPLIAARITMVLAQTGFPAERLEIEVMERCLLHNQEAALATLTSLKNQGVTISVDDFGTGYAALTQLAALPFDRMKLDRRFMESLGDAEQCDALVLAIMGIGKQLKLPVTAEGVETELLQKRIEELGCTDAQGWLFSKALSAEQVQLSFMSRAAAEILNQGDGKRDVA
jgi:diguanylate cyclase (GGDEF)-like protein